MFKVFLIPDIGDSIVVRPRVEKTADATMSFGMHEGTQRMIKKPWIKKMEVVVVRSDTKEMVRSVNLIRKEK